MSNYNPYPAYKDSGVEWIGQVPEHWGVKPIKIVTTYNDDVLPESISADALIEYVEISAVKYADGIVSTEKMPFGNAPSRARRTAKLGDVVISSVRTYLKAVAAVDESHADCVCSAGVVILRSKKGRVAPEFLKWLALNELLIQAVESHSEGLSYPAINAPELVNLKTVIPPLQEQSAIASALDRETTRIDTLITKKTRFIELLKEKRQALITHAVTKGLDPNVKMKNSGVEWIGEVPEHWRVCSLGYVTRASTGGTPDRKVDSYWNGSIPWAKTGEIRYETITKTEEFITPDGLTNSAAFVAEPGTILMAMYGMGVTRGRVAMLGIPAAFNQACAAISCNVGVHNWYVYYCLYSAYRFIRDLGNEASQINLNLEIISKIKIPVPPLNLQMEIAERLVAQLTKLDAIESKAQKTIDLLKERRSAFITAAVTGQIDLRGAA